MSLLYGSTYNNAVYYFLIANNSTHKEIGAFAASHNIGVEEFNTVVMKAKDIFMNGKGIEVGMKNRCGCMDWNLYYIITATNTFYLVVVHKESTFGKNENLVFELIEDIEYRGIKKLVDKNGELTNVGKQNLKFSIQKYQESAKYKYVNRGDDSGKINLGIVDTTISFQKSEIEMEEGIKEKEVCGENANEEVNMKEIGMENGLSGSEYGEFDDKKQRRKDLRVEFREGNMDINEVNKKKKYKTQIIFALIILVVISFILLYILL